jgi:hypothetical protein
LKVLVSTVALSLVITAPSFAADDGQWIPPVPAVPDIVVPGVGPAPTSSADPTPVVGFEAGAIQDPPPVSDETEVDGTPQIVAVSPAADEPVPHEHEIAAVVSALLEPDITPDVDPVDSPPTPTADAFSHPSSTPSVETDVPVPGLGPGDNKAEGQHDGSADLASDDEKIVPPSTAPEPGSAAGAPPSTPSSSSGSETSVLDSDSSRYHDDNLQYQSPQQSKETPWTWTWNLTVDCAGNATSTSTETGNQTSLVWNWEWLWDWACKSADIGSSVTTSTSSSTSGGNTNVSVRVLSPGDDGSVTQTTESTGTADGAEVTDASSTGLWNWNWTFTFCDETTAVSTLMDSQTPLSWTWTWMWNWTCDDATGAPPAPGEAAPPQADAAPVPPLSAVIPPEPALATPAWVPMFTVDVPLTPMSPSLLGASLVPSHEVVVRSVDVDVTVLLDQWVAALPELLLPVPGVAGVDVSVAILPAETPGTPARGGGGTPRSAHNVPGHRETESSTRPPMTTPIALQRSEGSSSGSSSTPTRKPHSAHSASPRQTHGPQLPFGQSRSYGNAGSSTSGGRVPSVSVAAVAAIIAFFILAAPRLGRRLRVARELSPRGTYRSSIDHPG